MTLSSIAFSSDRRSRGNSPGQAPAFRTARVVSAALLVLVAAGCSSEAPGPATPSSTGASSAKTAAAAVSSTGAKPASLAAGCKSEFHVDPQFGRDPFFPGADRSAKTAETRPSMRLPLISYLKLVGIRPGPSRPLALINRTTFAPGEEGDVSILITNQLSRAEVQKVNLRCLEIRRDSVLIRIAGEEDTKELHMAQAR